MYFYIEKNTLKLKYSNEYPRRFIYERSSAMAKLIEKTDIAPAWAAHFCGAPILLTLQNTHIIAFYDDTLHLAVAVIKDGTVELRHTDIKSDWNTGSHHAIALGIDRRSRIHVCAAMHAEPLRYMISGEGLNIGILEHVDSMTGSDEDSVTYPQFFNDCSGRLCFTYRSGVSGSGDQIINIWNDTTERWERLPQLTDGSVYPGGASAYFHNSRPIACPDGYMRAEFMWRADARAETCFDLCCIRSKDMVNWETESGEPVSLPVTPYTKSVTADPVPQQSGLTNMIHALGFDAAGRPVITYHKYDGEKSALFNARFKNGVWEISKAAEPLPEKWEFSGVGAIPHPFEISAMYSNGPDTAINVFHRGICSKILFDSETLIPSGTEIVHSPWGEAAAAEDSRTTVDWIQGRSDTPGKTYFLRWEHGANNRDREPEPPLPEPCMLALYEFDGCIHWLAEAH